MLLSVSDRERCLAQATHVHHKADHRCARLLIEIQARDLQGVHCEDVMMGRPRRWCRSAIAGLTEVCTRLYCSSGQILAATGARRQLLHGGWNIGDNPMPPSRTGRGIGIVTRYHEALGSFRRAFPSQMGRSIAARITHPVENLRLGHSLPILKIIARKPKPRHIGIYANIDWELGSEVIFD